MKDDRLRVPVETDYVKALGLAVFTFARLEWVAICFCERIKPGSIFDWPKKNKTAGDVSGKLKELIRQFPPSPEQKELYDAAVQFQKLARRRNELLHVQPGATANNAQRLFRDGVPWEIEKINEAADDFTECNIRLRDDLWYKIPLPPEPSC